MTQNDRRELWTTIHRYSGLAMMGFLFVAAVTGCVLCFMQPLDRALNSDLFVRSDASAPLDPLVAAEHLRAARPDLQILSFPLHLDPRDTLPVEVAAAPGAKAIGYDQLFVDGNDGHVAGTRQSAPGWGRRGIVEGIKSFHYTLLAGDWGRWLMGLMALTWFVSNLVGVYLTWPRKTPYWKTWKRMWRFSFKSMFARLMLDVHRSTGLWLLIGVTMLAFTSVCLNFYGEAYEPAVTRIAPLKHTLFAQPAPFPDGARPTLAFADAVTLAERQAAKDGLKWTPATALYVPTWNLYGVTLTNDGRLNYRDLGPVYYYFDARTGRYAHVVDPYSDSAGLVMIRMLYPLHSGRVAGWPTVALIFLLGLATIEMTITGFYVWWKKRKSRVAGRLAAARRQSGNAAKAEAPAR
ncbi:MAG TPA: PepSY-associated TM helix domain-containing protein [Sphingomonas sp.]